MTPQVKYQRKIRQDPLQRQSEAAYQREHRSQPDVKKRLAAYFRGYRKRKQVKLRAYDRLRKARAKEIKRQQDLVARGLIMRVRI